MSSLSEDMQSAAETGIIKRTIKERDPCSRADMKDMPMCRSRKVQAQGETPDENHGSVTDSAEDPKRKQ